MGEDRLCGLSLMSIESELTRPANFLDNVVQKFKDNGIADGKIRRIVLWCQVVSIEYVDTDLDSIDSS